MSYSRREIHLVDVELCAGDRAHWDKVPFQTNQARNFKWRNRAFPGERLGSGGQFNGTVENPSANTSTSKGQVVLHPIMFAIYPSAFLYAANITMLDLSVVVAPIAIVTTVAVLLWGLMRLVTGDWKTSAVFTSLPLLAFFSYGALEQAIGASGDAWSSVISVCLLIACAATLALLKWKKLLDPATYVLNVISLLLVGGPLLQAGLWSYGAYTARQQLASPQPLPSKPASIEAGSQPPDIYYFVLDGYGREDVLREDYQLDNSPFLEGLRKRGFYVADEAVSNYAYTLASLTSTMNMGYLQDIVGEELGANPDRRFLREKMADNQSLALLQSAGYSVVSFRSEYSEAQLGSVDVDLSQWWFASQFTQTMGLMTPIPALLNAFGAPSMYDLHRYRTLYPFERMSDAISVPGRKFVYTHSFYGHPPFVFGPSGERIVKSADYKGADPDRLAEKGAEKRRDYVDGYVSQVQYLNGRLLETIDEILARSEQPPVIVIHGDHGPGVRYQSENIDQTDLRERFSILYAVLLPEGGAEAMYPTITPINGLRIVLNHSIGADLPMLKDETYFSGFETPYVFSRVDSEKLRRNPDEVSGRPEDGSLAPSDVSELSTSPEKDARVDGRDRMAAATGL